MLASVGDMSTFTRYYISGSHTETYLCKLLQKQPKRVLPRTAVNTFLLQLERPPNENSRNWKTKPVLYIVAADVKALYPSLSRDTETKALECALEKHSSSKPRPVKSSSNWTKFAWTMWSLNMETNYIYKKTRNCKAKTSVLHCSSRCESTLPKLV